ncbi:MAG: Isoquinoline 1-oxidoreductase subunit beta [Pseudomonadota bacterium]|jgi:isoquinoline 1-oxidoreductase beta subunit
MSASLERPDRRQFLQQATVLSGALVLGFQTPSAQAASSSAVNEVTHWVVIQPDDTVVIRIARSELGQGSMTGLAMLVAEELGCDWAKVRAEYANVNEHMRRDKIWKDMTTGGSRGIRDSQEYLRQAGAAARSMLVAAAAQRWKVSAAECQAAQSVVTHPSGLRATYGELAALASTLPVPTTVKLKDPKDWTLIGTSPARFDLPAKVDGSQSYAVDMQLPGMLHAAIFQSPVFGGRVKRVDDSKARNMPGVRKIVTSDEWVAVVATNWWQAQKAVRALQVEWNNGAHGAVTSASIRQKLEQDLAAPTAPIARKDGDTVKAFANANKVLEAQYFTGYVNHATMEPQNATALLQGDQLQVWVGTQSGEASINAAAQASGLPVSQIQIHKMHTGGAFGRRVLHQDYTVQAVKLAMAMPGVPIKLMWSREEDMRQGRYRPVSLVKLRGALDKEGQWTAWEVRQADQSIAISVMPNLIKDGIDPIGTRVFRDNPYAVPSFTNEYALNNFHVPPGFWRAVAHTNNPFYRECFIDELANAAGQDPYAFRRPLLKGKKDLAVLDAAAQAIGWNQAPAKGVHRGIAVVDSYGSFTAAAVELSVQDKQIKVHRVAVAIDSGHVVHPDAVKAQIEGGVIWGLSALMFEDITIDKGAVVQGNFADYPLARFPHAPEVISVLVPTGDFWGGVGEPPIGGVIPAAMNALFKATGERIRSLPLRHHGYSFQT